jgi:DNA-binding CsgD family transcriptional regulator
VTRQWTGLEPGSPYEADQSAHQPRVVDQGADRGVHAALQRIVAPDRHRGRGVITVVHREDAAGSQYPAGLGQGSLGLGDVAQGGGGLGAALAVATARDRDHDAAAEGLATALSAGANYPLFGALVRRLVAEAAIETGFTDPVPLLREAEAAFTEQRLPRPAAAVRATLTGLGAASPRRRRGDGTVDGDLLALGVTLREAEVLDLLADRLTNRQIGQRLYLSPKTVEKHVAALARKLDAHDRVELADRAHSRRRTPG